MKKRSYRAQKVNEVRWEEGPPTKPFARRNPTCNADQDLVAVRWVTTRITLAENFHRLWSCASNVTYNATPATPGYKPVPFDVTGRGYSPMILTSTRLRRRPSNSP